VTKAKATAADMNREVELAKARAKARPQEYGRAVDATGPQRSDSGAPNPDTDGLVTVELTREEAEHAMARGEHPSNAPMIPDFSCPDCKRIAAKFRASLERTGK